VPLGAPGEGRIRAKSCRAQPNTRLKLTAPVRNGCGCRRTHRCASILFVNFTAGAAA
jgi:hypothetical protein